MKESAPSVDLSAVEDMVFDEEKIVTYLSLSKEMCIHINDSKMLLKHFVEHCRKKRPETELSVTHIISGLCDSNHARTTVCTAEEIEEVKNKFKTIFFEHIYSVSKGNPKVDKAAFTLINKLDDFGLYKGLITNNICMKHSSDEMSALKTISQESKPPEKPKIQTNQKNIFKNEPGNKASGSKEAVVKAEVVESVKVKTEVVSPKKNGSINNKPKTDHKPQKGIAGFFNKQNGTTKKLANVAVEVKKEDKIKEDKVEVMDTDEIPEIKKEEPKKKETYSNNVNEKKSTNKNSINQIKKNAKVDKKRKRVLHVSDSESDDEKNDPFANVEDAPMDTLDSDDEIPQTPNVTNIKITSGIVNPKKRRKIVDKTYTDEDGYILTKKEEVYESCSDNDESEAKENAVSTNRINSDTVAKENVKETKNAPAKSTKKKVSPPKGKQATLTSFFKKV